MDPQTQDQQQKDLFSSFFPLDIPNDVQRGIDAQQQMQMYPYSGSASPQQTSMASGSSGHQSMQQNPNSNMNLELLSNLMQLQGPDSHPQSPLPTGQFNPQVLLEQQFKLQQLQQLQNLSNQILQQQLAIISGQANNSISPDAQPEPQRELPASFHGLPTPGPSAELRAQPNPEYVSPIFLQYADNTPGHYQNSASGGGSGGGMDSLTPLPHQLSHRQAQYSAQHGSTSAPAHIAFRSSPGLHVPPTDLDLDISPLTSPWLGAYQQAAPRHKRTVSPGDDEATAKPPRKKASPAIRPTNPAVGAKKVMRPSKSTNSTPLLRATRSRKGSTAAEGDTPSPVDLSMPPPAPPANPGSSSASTSSDVSMDNYQSTSPHMNPHLTPVTPASIMNLGRLGINSSLSPPSGPYHVNGDPKGKSARGKATTETSRRTSKRTSIVSPNLKAILPAGQASPLDSNHSGSLHQPVVQVRKTSHKAAEQKRRDSLKTTFDDLRLLLPPIPLPSDDNFPDEPILPGALPPRGPPKAGGEGPNKGVSKLQLLMCGNDFIRQLKARVERRDEEIDKLRREVGRLRSLVGIEEAAGAEEVDLERDLDAVEAFGAALGRGGSAAGDDEGDEDGED